MPLDRSLKRWEIALMAGVLCALLCGFWLGEEQTQLADRVIRFHVIANSDSPEDQALKLQVRDAVLEEAARWYEGAASMEEASAALCLHLESISGAARKALKAQGADYSATAQVTELYFPTRDYEGFRLPAGRYRTRRVTRGGGGGKTWWCVVFPALCLPAAPQEDALLALPEGEREIVGTPEGYAVKFKLVELWESLREWLRN